MLSNLRIDRECHNSFVIPEDFRILDPYVRIETAEVGGGNPNDRDLERHLLAWLWSPAELKTARESWCGNGRTIRLRATHRQQELAIDDLCKGTNSAGIGIETAWQGFRRYQTNLTRQCPQACIH